MDTTNRAGTKVSMGVSRFGDIDFSQGDFKLLDANGNPKPFNLKNETGEDQELQVVAWDLPDVAQSCVFRPGWNEEILREIKAITDASLKFKWGE